GSTLWLPVWREGALFSCGDSHAAQGDGEVCVSAIECAMHATLRFGLHKRTIPGPAFDVPRAVGDPGPHYGTMGIDADLMEGARTAVRHMIEWLPPPGRRCRAGAGAPRSPAAAASMHESLWP